MLRLFSFFFIFLFFACGRTYDINEAELNLTHLDNEITDREAVLSKDTSFSKDLSVIRKDVANLNYLTIDIENINASIIKSNAYFKPAAARYGVDTAGFIDLYKGDPLWSIKNVIRKNHLNLLNKIIIHRNKNGSLMYTAQ